MKIAMPIENGVLCAHFGHAPQFGFVDCDKGDDFELKIYEPPPHEPGVLPKWLRDMGVTHLVCGGIGARAVQLLESYGIKVIAGVTENNPITIAQKLASNQLAGRSGATCNHSRHGMGGCNHK